MHTTHIYAYICVCVYKYVCRSGIYLCVNTHVLAVYHFNPWNPYSPITGLTGNCTQRVHSMLTKTIGLGKRPYQCLFTYTSLRLALGSDENKTFKKAKHLPTCYPICLQCQCQFCRLCFGKELFLYTYIHTHIYICIYVYMYIYI